MQLIDIQTAVSLVRKSVVNHIICHCYFSILELPKPPSNVTLNPKFSNIYVCFTLPDNEMSTATQFKIMYWPTDAPKNVTTVVVDKSKFKCPFDISGLEDDTLYSFKIAVANKIAFGADSSISSAKTNRASKCLEYG